MSALDDTLPPADQGKPLTSGLRRLIRLLAAQAAVEKRNRAGVILGPADILER